MSWDAKLYQSYRTYELSKLVKRSLCLVTPCTLAGYYQRFRRTDRLKTSVSSTRSHGATTHKATIDILTALRTSNTSDLNCMRYGIYISDMLTIYINATPLSRNVKSTRFKTIIQDFYLSLKTLDLPFIYFSVVQLRTTSGSRPLVTRSANIIC
jgi:hypothetical protein